MQQDTFKGKIKYIDEFENHTIINMFFFKDQRNYNLYIICQNGVFLYENVDKGAGGTRVPNKIVVKSEDNLELSKAVDCNREGMIVFDQKKGDQPHRIQCFRRDRVEEIYDYQLDYKKEFVKWFKDYVIEVKRDDAANKDKIAIYDFKNKLSMHTESYFKIKQIEVEDEHIFLTTSDAEGKTLVI